MVLWWALGVTILYYSQAVSIEGLYADQAELDRAAASMESNAAFIAMAGPAGALNTIGGQVTWQSTAFGAIVVGLMSMFLDRPPHPRRGGERPRRAGPRGRRRPARADDRSRSSPPCWRTCSSACLVAGSLISFPLAVEDSLALGLGLTATGWVFTGVALVAAQLTSSTRAMYGLVGAVIGVSFVLRAVGDVGNPALSWLSPIGWYQAMHAFSGVRWWPALLSLAAAGALTAIGYAVFARRDFGDGVLPSRPGPARAPAGLRSGLGLAWRLHRGSLLGWSLGTGRLSGSPTARWALTSATCSATARRLARCSRQGGSDLVDGFYATSMLALGLMALGLHDLGRAAGPRRGGWTAGSRRYWPPGSRGGPGRVVTSS